MRCYVDKPDGTRCDSKEHLARDCPFGKGKGRGHGGNRNHNPIGNVRPAQVNYVQTVEETFINEDFDDTEPAQTELEEHNTCMDYALLETSYMIEVELNEDGSGESEEPAAPSEPEHDIAQEDQEEDEGSISSVMDRTESSSSGGPGCIIMPNVP